MCLCVLTSVFTLRSVPFWTIKMSSILYAASCLIFLFLTLYVQISHCRLSRPHYPLSPFPNIPHIRHDSASVIYIHSSTLGIVKSFHLSVLRVGVSSLEGHCPPGQATCVLYVLPLSSYLLVLHILVFIVLTTPCNCLFVCVSVCYTL